MAIKDQLAEIVGKDNVLDSPEVIEIYGRDYSPEPTGLFTCVVRPKDAKETQKVIQLANEAKFAVVPQSSGIHFNGDAIPKMGGVVLDLSRMNQITEIDEESKVAHIEVGVNWEQLHSVLEARGYRTMIPLLPHPSRSVISDWLERELPVVQIHEYADPLLCLQVIWGNGEEFVTGTASINTFRDPQHPECLADGVSPDGPGPINFDEFLYGAQGTLGVVTWGIVKFEEIPTLTKTFFIPTDRAEDAIEPIYKILRRRVGYECLLINNMNLATILTERWPEQFAELRKSLPPWTTILVIGALKRRPEEKIAYEEEFLQDLMLTQFPNLKLLTTLPGIADMEKRTPEMLRKPWPANKTYWKHAYKGSCQDLTFMTTLDRVEKFLPVVTEVAARYQYPTSEVGGYIQPVGNGRACQLQFNFYYDPDNEDEKEKIRRLYTDAATAMLERGAYFTKLYGAVPDIVYRKNGDYTSTLKRVKKLFDPNAILNPGHLCF
jgi:hypothetical protein